MHLHLHVPSAQPGTSLGCVSSSRELTAAIGRSA